MDDRPELLLHAGPHKTGTSALQDWLTANRRSLAKQGVLFPTAGQPGTRGQHNLYWQLAGHRRYRGDVSGWPELWQEIAASRGVRQVVISAEGFSHLLTDPKRTAALRDILAPRFSKVTLLVVARPQWSLVPAVFGQTTKRGDLTGLAAYIQQALAERPRPAYLAYDVFLRRIAAQCPEWQLRPHRYRSEPERPEALLDEVFGQSLPLERIRRTWRYRPMQRANPTAGLPALCRRWLAAIEETEGLVPQAALTQAVQWLEDHRPTAAISLTPTETAALAARFEPGNERLKERHGLSLGSPDPVPPEAQEPAEALIAAFLREPKRYLQVA